MDPDPDWIRIRIGNQPKMLDPDPYQINTDPKPWFLEGSALERSTVFLQKTMPIFVFREIMKSNEKTLCIQFNIISSTSVTERGEYVS